MTALNSRNQLFAVVIAAAMTLIVGCRDAAPPATSVIADSSDQTGWPRVFTDDLGVEITLDMPPQRIVSISPGMTEIIFALGEGDRLVGVTDFCDYPPEAAETERIGGMTNPSIEKIVGLDPDLTLIARGAPIEVVKALRAAGLPVIGKSAATLADVIDQVRDIGEYLGVEEQAAGMADGLERRRSAVSQQAEGLYPDDDGPSVLMIIGLEPVFVAGPGSFVDDMIELCGGRNVVGGEGEEQVSAWPQYSLERIVEHDPEIILSALGGHEMDEGGTLARLRGLAGWSELTAVKRGRVHDIDGDIMLRTGPRLLDGLEDTARLIQSCAGEVTAP